MPPPSSTARSLARFVAAIVAIAPRRAVTTTLLTLAVALAEGAGLLVLIPLLQLVGIETDQGALGQVMARFRAAFAAVGLVPTLPIVLVLYVAIVAAQSVLLRLQTVVTTRLREEVVDKLRVRLYAAVAGTTWVYFSRSRAATFGQLLTSRVDRVASAAYYLLDLFVTSVVVLVYVALALRVSPGMTALVLAGGAALALAMRTRLRLAQQTGSHWNAASTRLHSATFDHLESMKMAKGYGAERRHAERFAQLSRELSEASRGSTDVMARTRQWMAIGSAVLLALIVYAAQVVMQMPTAALFLLIFLFARLVPRVTSLYERAQVLATELPVFQTVIEAEARCLEAAEQEAASHEPVCFERAIELRHVTFGYRDTDDAPALHDVNLGIAARSTTAIVGPSGAGKSTLADLLMGLLTPTAGVVAVDDVPLMPERLRSWRSQIGYVSQETYLFHDTVRANLLWACPGASDAELWQALQQAAADDFVRALPQGLDTVVGDRGVLLSGGERQRLSLARALLRRPGVLLLDEATSSLDSENERRIQAAIDRLHEQITIIVITHRLSTIRNADVIHVLELGRIVESGSWGALLADPAGRFRALCVAQGIEVPTRDRADDVHVAG